jgi:hypothetical protein
MSNDQTLNQNADRPLADGQLDQVSGGNLVFCYPTEPPGPGLPPEPPFPLPIPLPFPPLRPFPLPIEFRDLVG